MENEILSFYVRGAPGPYEKPSPASLATAQELFQQLLQSRSVEESGKNSKWSSLGFGLKKISDGGMEFAVVSEAPSYKGRGNGFYVVKLSSSGSGQGSVILQAMHTPSDLYIHKVAYKLLMENNLFVAGAWNTAHRSKVDLGKETSSYFNSFTAAVARSFSRPRIIQLHAFDAISHKINGDMILSSSRSSSSLEAAREEQYQRLITSLRKELKQFTILHFPRDVKVLGGTLNVNARVFYENNPEGQFFHVEMSLPLRVELRDKQETRSNFTRSFL